MMNKQHWVAVFAVQDTEELDLEVRDTLIYVLVQILDLSTRVGFMRDGPGER
jgi:hypothetical protein